MKNFTYLKAFFSPFIAPKIRGYIGKIKHGTPYFYPRNWIKNEEKPGYLKAIPKKIGFDFVNLGWKTKWEVDDFRHEWSPMWSFVFFKWQICIFFIVPEPTHYWSSWLYYELKTHKNKSFKERIEKCKEEFPQLCTRYTDGKKETIDYYTKILKTKYYERRKK